MAQIEGSRGERFKAWAVGLLSPPRFTREPADAAMWWWSMTGAMAAGFGLGVTVLMAKNALTTVNLTLSLAWSVFIVLGIPIFILPFLVSFAVARLLPLRSRWAGAGYGALFHAAAHCAVLYGLRLPPLAFPVICAPIVVGALWGSWLPAALD